MNKSVPIDLLMFDFDGTLADSIPAAEDSIQAMIAELGYPPKEREEIKSHIGFGEWELVAGSIGSRDKEKVAAAQKVYYKYVSNNLEKVPLFPRVKEMLEHFKDKDKVIISNKRDEFILKVLANHRIMKYFKEVLGGESAPCLKPDPCALLAEIEKVKVPLSRVLFVGDMTIDVETGKNAKVKTCAVTYGFDSREKLKEARPDFIIDDMSELEKIIV
jgi:phosphoglycolate phosphatase